MCVCMLMCMCMCVGINTYMYMCVCDPQTRAAKQDIGKVFLLFAEINAAEKCNAAMHNRTFSDRQIRAYFLPEEEFISLKLAYQ
jgi:hypothetical protein